ncbi:MAG TPA: fatty acyl-AMP ligase [Mycobacterium sp.]|nr:fatty acyl-AMP ligase [Mycobacterium sp.]HQC77779.1 fatty acyl-AMP ligase [Mycobacterium sp.]
MDRGQHFVAPAGLLDIEDCVDARGEIALPPGTTLVSLIERNVAGVGDTVAYRFLDFARSEDSVAEITWAQLDVRMRAIAARIQQITTRTDRVAILVPAGLDYVAAFFAVLKSGRIAVPLFAPELPGHAERLAVALADATPALLLTTESASEAVEGFLGKLPGSAPPVLVIDQIPESAAAQFDPVDIDMDDISHLQYSSGATRAPVGIEITHRAFVTNLVQMILSIDLLNRNTHGVSWLPLYHDMGLSMIGFPATYGGHSTLMAPTAFVRRPYRWIRALSDACREGRVVTAAPNFAYEWAAQRGLPPEGERLDLSTAVMIIGSEPVSMTAIDDFNRAFAPHGLPPTAIKPSYGIAEATLFIANITPDARAAATYFDGDQLAAGRAVRVAPETPNAFTAVSCGIVARSLRAVVVDPETGEELADGSVGEFWLHGDNVGKGYWQRPEETESTFGAHLAARVPAGSRADGVGVDARWLRTGDLGMFFEGELYVTGRIVDLLTIGGRNFYPQEIEATAAGAASLVRRGYLAAISTPGGDGGEQLVIIAERATGTSRSDPGEAIEAIRAAVKRRHGLDVADIRILPAGAIPRTTSGKLARRAARNAYLEGSLKGHQR